MNLERTGLRAKAWNYLQNGQIDKVAMIACNLYNYGNRATYDAIFEDVNYYNRLLAVIIKDHKRQCN